MKRSTICLLAFALLAFALFAGSLFAETIHEAAKEGNINRLKFLIKKGAKVNARADDGDTPLHLAAAYSLPVAELLIKERADVNARDIKGSTPLDWAAGQGNTETAELLKKHGGTKQPLRLQAS